MSHNKIFNTIACLNNLLFLHCNYNSYVIWTLENLVKYKLNFKFKKNRLKSYSYITEAGRQNTEFSFINICTKSKSVLIPGKYFKSNPTIIYMAPEGFLGIRPGSCLSFSYTISAFSFIKNRI